MYVLLCNAILFSRTLEVDAQHAQEDVDLWAHTEVWKCSFSHVCDSLVLNVESWY